VGVPIRSNSEADSAGCEPSPLPYIAGPLLSELEEAGVDAAAPERAHESALPCAACTGI
jgi:hypothetical protein